EKFFITTAIPYTNAEPHIGHLLEFIQADVIARFKKLQGKEVFFLTGTDEHGTKISQTAKERGKEPKEFVDYISAKFQESADALNINYSYFIRTTDQQKHWPNVRKIWQALKESGDIYKGHYSGKYCVGCEKYLVESDLENGVCPIHKTEPEIFDEENYFFRLSKYQNELKKIIQVDELKIIPEFRKAEVLSFLAQGLEDVSFSRPKEKLNWGIPVPDDDSQVIYVWADALTNYLSGIDYANAGAQFQRFWPPDLQIVGKDIWKFHALIWPAMLLSAHLPLPKALMIHGFLTINGQKISKSLGNVVSPIGVMQKFGVSADSIRYFFLREINPFEDGDYSDEKFIQRYNSDLANGVGNLLARVLKLGSLYHKEITLSANELEQKINQAWQEYYQLFENYKFNEALSLISNLVSAGDEYLNQKKPWGLLKNSDQESVIGFQKTLSSLVILLANLAWLYAPFMSEASEKILLALGLTGEKDNGWQNKKLVLSE
ncbi:MAG: methionine--tRNA ligase, partial [Patescibacteria group bacterium]